MLNWNLIALIQEVILSVSQESLFLRFQSAQLQRPATVSKNCFSNNKYCIISAGNHQGTDQTVYMHSLIGVFAVLR